MNALRPEGVYFICPERILIREKLASAEKFPWQTGLNK
jgi:hypothetical protein